MIQCNIGRRAVSLFSANTKAACVWLNTFSQEAKAIWSACQELKTPPFTLAEIQIDDWDAALSPLHTKAVFKGAHDFAGQAYVNLQGEADRMHHPGSRNCFQRSHRIIR